MDTSAIITLLEHGRQLKQTQRTGWVRQGVPQAESVAAHSYGVVFTALTLASLLSDPLDLTRLLVLATLHDLPEALTSDIPSPVKAFFPEPLRDSLKTDIERAALQTILVDAPFAGRWKAWWEELQADQSPEAHLVHDADKLDLYLQALAYEEQTGNRRLAEFWAEPPTFHFALAQAIFTALCARREGANLARAPMEDGVS